MGITPGLSQREDTFERKQLSLHDKSPFGAKPYICLNKASNHFGKPVVEEIEITYCNKTKLLIGTFKCSCGFHYSRRETDDTYKIRRIKQFGEIWVERCKYLINDRKYSYRAAARELNVDTNTIIKYSNIRFQVGKLNFHSDVDKTISKMETNKKSWLKLIAENPNISVPS
ncbi:TnsD family Tn7-like transposition protein [Mesobacillus stamsii]|nr:TnsD family Tn7-like transposition protein [Mesobacillus stamsii]